MAKFALLGGKSSPMSSSFLLEEKVFSVLKIKPKRILFIPFATHIDIRTSFAKFLKMVNGKYEVRMLSDLTNLVLVQEEIEFADVLYFGGGCAEELVKKAKAHSFDQILKDYLATDKLLMGISAGAIFLCRWGMGDRYAYKSGDHIYNYQLVEGIGLLDYVVCPHYDHDGLECFNDAVKGFSCDAYALEDDTAIVLEETARIVKTNPIKSVYQFLHKEGYLMLPLYEKR